MQQVQLYIDGNRVDLFKDEQVSLTQTIQNIKDPAKIFTEFSQSFTIPASKTNNKLFKHYYRLDIANNFDARLKVSAEIRLNNIPFRTGYIQLTSTTLKNNTCEDYSVVFYGKTITLKEVIGDDYLSDLDWLDNFSTTYGPSVMDGALQNGINKSVGSTYTDALIAPIITHTKFLYYDSVNNLTKTDGNLHNNAGNTTHGLEWSDLKYSIRMSIIVEAIEKKYGLIFSNDFFSNSNEVFYDLYMWLHRNQGPIGGKDLGSNPTITTTLSILPTVTFGGTQINSSTIVQTAAPGLNSTADIFFNLNVSDASATFDFLVVDSGGAVVLQDLGLTGSTSYQIISFATTTETYRVQIRTADIFSILSISQIRVRINDPINEIYFDVYTSFTGTQLLAQDTQFIITENVPKIKVLDFLTGLFKMWNLTAYVDDVGRIVVLPLDSYYSSPTYFDITKHIDISKSQVKPSIPYNEVIFQNEDYKTYTAALFSQINGSRFGELEYKGEETGEWVGGKYDVKIPFQKMMYNRILDLATLSQKDTQYGWFVNEEQAPYSGKPLLHYASRISNGDPIAWSIAAGTFTGLTTYYIPLNSRNLLGTGQSLNFHPENDEYTGTINAVTLFETYYREFFSAIFSNKQKLTKITANLPLSILLKYSLADRFVINGINYKINSITSNLQTGESSIELLNEV